MTLISEHGLSLWELASRIIRYTNRHLQHHRRRSLLPIATIATGTILIYAVLTLTVTIQRQMTQLSGTLSPETAEAIAHATVYVAILTLIVGALETAVIMTRSVLSRVQEIGILKATGVKQPVIFSLFVTEAFIYGVVGGVAGVILGWGIVAAVQIADGANVAIALMPVWQNAVTALVLATGVSVVTAWFPIWRTVRLSAMQALYFQF